MEMKEIFIRYSKTEEYTKKLREAQNIVEEAITKYKAYVAFSGGKDSTCVLHLSLKVDPEILVWHWDYGTYMPREFEREIINNAKKIGTKNFEVYKTKSYLWKEKVFYREFFGKVHKNLKARGYNAVLLGLRKEESHSRKYRITHQIYYGEMREFYPLQNWTWRDVWACIFSNSLPYHSAYGLYIPVVGWENARFSTFFDPEFDTLGAPNLDTHLLWRWKHVMEKAFRDECFRSSEGTD